MYKTIFVSSKFKKTQERFSENKGQSESLWLGKSDIPKDDIKYEPNHKYSDCLVDGHRLSVETGEAIKKLGEEGFRVVNISPITSGSYEVFSGLAANSSFGYGFSYTEGVLICAEKT
jgi:hypothetical protein